MKIIVYTLICAVTLGVHSTAKGSSPAKEDKKAHGIYLTDPKEIARVTGKPAEGETWLCPNRTDIDYDVYGTDLGIMWHMGGDRVGLFFGDTNGKGFEAGKGGGNGGNWRSNVVAFSNDGELEDGLIISGMEVDDEGKAREICAGGKSNPETYQTSIPSGAIRAGGLDCVHYMNIYDWAGGNGRWLTNFSSMYTSADDGRTWHRQPGVTFASDSYFSQVTYAKKGETVYMIGTLSGRSSGAYLARFAEKDILDMTRYEYWNGDEKRWIKGDEKAATPIIRAPVGEASLMYHEKYKRWIITYNCDYAFDPAVRKRKHAILYQDTEEITDWSGERKTLLTADRYPGLYCAYLHPLKNSEDRLYFLMSLWQPYNVFLLSADIDYRK